jgi:membrane-associated phospholipid phosphatase
MAKTIPATKHCFIILSFLCVFASPANAQNADINLLKELNLHRDKNLDGGMKAVTNSVYPIASVIPIAELAAGYLKHDSALINTGWVTIAGLGLNFVTTFGLKYAVNRTRPYVTYPVLEPYQHDSDPSFPSGHTSFAFNTATSLTLHCHKWYVVVPAYTWATAVAWSRMDLGMHYPSDVLAGAIVGTGTAYLAYKGNKWLQHHKKAKHTSLGH